MRLLHAVRVLYRTGVRLRCPHCGMGKMSASRFKFHTYCHYCLSRYERGHGEALGGMYINTAFAELTALMGFFAVDALTDLPALPHIGFWLVYVVLFCLLFYRYARGLWIGVVYLTGGVYPDPDYMKQYFRSDSRSIRTQRERKK